jgi:hypothetical protein
VRTKVSVATMCFNNVGRDVTDRGDQPDFDEVCGENPRGFPVLCRPWRWSSPLVDQASRWPAWGGLIRDGGSPVVSKPSDVKVVDFVIPEECVGDETWG